MAAPARSPARSGSISSSNRSTNRSRRSDREDEDDEEAGIWAALERQPTYDRIRTTILGNGEGSEKESYQVEVKDVDRAQYLKDQVFKLNNPSEDNEKFLEKLRNRIEKAGVEIPTVEVRYENLCVQGEVHIGSRALPTLSNTVLDFVDTILRALSLSRTTKTDLTILDGVTGILKPGRMTLLLGPPSSGKTSLLLALAGQLDPDLNVQGTISYNGYKLDEFVPKKTAAYVSQSDLHLAELTVRETMDYSARFQGVGNRYDLISELLKKEKELGIQPDKDTDFFMKASAVEDISHDLMTRYYMKIMGLDICADTIVGNQMLKGISGGQRKRLTTAEMIVGPAKALFMDEISTGLDSSTTFQVVKCMGQFASISGETVLMSLLQPPPETYGLFDEVLLLSGGQVVYHGPRENVEEFFESCGFRCPPRKGIADFLQEVTSIRDQEQYWVDKNRPYQFVPAKQFADAYKNFHVGQSMSQEMSTPFDKSKSHRAALAFDRWSLPQWDLFKITLRKELLMLRKNIYISAFIVTQLAMVSALTASLYFRTENHRRTLDDAQKYSGALFTVVIEAVFVGFGEITFTALRFPTFSKFRGQQFFPPWTWALASFIIRIPLAALETFSFLALCYYIVGFAPSAARFFRLWLLLAIADVMASAFFRMIAGFCRTAVLASSIGGFFIMALFTLGGYVIPRTDIRGWWIWAYWALPLSYVQNGAAVNEYLAHQWRKPLPNDSHTLGHRFILSLGLFDRGYWFWLACGALVLYAIGFTILFAGAVTFLRPPDKTRAVVSQELLAEWHANRTGEGLEGSRKAVPLPRSISNSVKNGSASKRGSNGAMEDSNGGRRAAETVHDMDPMASTSSRSLHRDDSSASNASASGFAPKRGMILPFQPFAISFKDVNYSVDMPSGHTEQGATGNKLQLLRGITGAFRPGVLTALVGVTGAGKSTLMDVLSGRKTRGYEEGDIRINGFPKRQDTFIRIAGYCEQNDIHSPQITVHESLIFSAWLRLQPEIASETKMDFVQEVMDLVELTPLKDALVGVPGESGLSTEQRKRLTVAVELVTNPSIIFMDEPTSGLDARAAATVMRTVRNTVDTGRTVVCTIHQPSIDIFETFDELLLLKTGGQTIYAGPLGRQSHRLVEYFQAIPGVPSIKDGENPAAWMLEITTAGMEQKLGVDFAELYRNSSASERTNDLVEQLSTSPPHAEDISFPTKFAQPLWTQFICCLWKQHWVYWRSPGYNVMRFGLSMGSGVFMGTVFWGLGKKIQTQRNLFSLMGSIYTSQSFYGILTASAVQPLINSERTVFYREKSAGMYSETAYALAQCLIEIPYVLLSSIAFVCIEYPMIKLEWDAGKFFWYLFFTFTSQVTFVYCGMLTVSLSPNAEIGAVLLGFMCQLWSLFNGFAIPHPQFPDWWRWVYWCNPQAYTLYGTIASQLGDLDGAYITSQTGMVFTVKQLIKRSYGFKHSFLWFIGSMAAVFPLVFAVGFIVCIKFLNYQQR